MRIIAGKYGGRNIKSIDSIKTRPTLDKVKEAVFSMVMPLVDLDYPALDLYAGSGALGIEAVSRGQVSAYLVDKSKAATRIIEENIASLRGQADFKVLNLTADTAITQISQPLSLIFFDPPYDLAEQVINKNVLKIVKLDLLIDGAIVVIETNLQTDILLPNFFELLKDKNYGIARIKVFRFNKEHND